ncbi:MAG: ribonuclease J [Mollicutes bacterium]|jgi:ribonuclease J|nr:ribonuclease J [Mollicutes bacterium]
MKNEKTTNVFALGGLGEVGKNMYIIEHDTELFIIDAGVMFPESDLLGIDYVIQDITYLTQNKDKIKGLIITHGHEDHIGGISFLLQAIDIPIIYAPNIAAAIIRHKLEDRNIKYDKIEIYDKETIIETKYFKVEFINTTHSIPDSFCLVFHTPNGVVVTTGDFKFDLTPIGPMADLHKMAEIGKKGVKLLLSDSTNALVSGYSKSESVVDEALSDIFAKHLGRIIIATFASNLFRVKHIIETCKKNNRKVLVFGRSMEMTIDIAFKSGLLTDKTTIINANEAKNFKKNEICILCTGSQGEPLAALSRIANGTHKQIQLIPDDIVIFSSSPIPGNASSINRIINKLYLKGVKVFTNQELSDIHTSGHGKTEELKLILRLFKPEYFMPMHGEYRMLKAHADLAIECEVKKENIFIMGNGEVLSLGKEQVFKNKTVPSGDVYVDGSRIGDVGSVVIRDRKLMSKDGILIAIINLDAKNKKLLIKPNVTTRGFILVNENLDLVQKIETKIEATITKFFQSNTYNLVDLKNQIILELNPFINDLTGRRPIIMPVIMEINE